MDHALGRDEGNGYKDAEENLPPLMEQYFAEFRQRQARTKRGDDKK